MYQLLGKNKGPSPELSTHPCELDWSGDLQGVKCVGANQEESQPLSDPLYDAGSIHQLCCYSLLSDVLMNIIFEQAGLR